MSRVRSSSVCTLVCLALVASAHAQAVLHPQDSIHSPGDAFGDPVVLQGTRLAVGAPLASGAGSGSGELRLYDVGPPLAWQATLVGSDLSAGDHFGGSAALDGDVLVVGADRHAHGPGEAGAAYVFRWNGSAFVQEAELMASDRAGGDNFGSGVAVSGERIVVGAPGCDTTAGADQGALYVFERVGGAWTEVFKGIASDGASVALGWRVSLDGNRALAASPLSGGLNGAVYSFLRGSAGWAPETIFTPPAGTGTGEFGYGQSVSADVVAIGMPFCTGSGAVFVYRLVAGSWTLEASLHLVDGNGLDQFGCGVELQGNRFVAGARGLSVWNYWTGAAFLFERIGGVWKERLQLVPESGAQNDYLGMTVALDWPRAAVGGAAPLDTAHVFALSDLVGSAFCLGDGGGSACPCANESLPGLDGGCLNGFGRGAVLAATGSTSVAADDLVLSFAHGVHGYGWPPYGTPILLLAGTAQVNGGLGALLGDGLKCVEGGTQRLAVRLGTPFGAGLTVFPGGMIAHGGWSAGDVRHFQAWYRDPGGPCGTRFNTSNGLRIAFTP